MVVGSNPEPLAHNTRTLATRPPGSYEIFHLEEIVRRNVIRVPVLEEYIFSIKQYSSFLLKLKKRKDFKIFLFIVLGFIRWFW